MKNEGLHTEQEDRKRSSGWGLKKQLIILALIPALIVGGFMSILLIREFEAKKHADQIRGIADYMVVASQVVHQLQRERVASVGYLASNGDRMTGIMEKQRRLTNKYFSVLNNDIKSLDIMMPEMDGYEAIGEIRKQKKFKKLPIIALTAKAMKGDRSKCIEAGANDYLAKPFEIDRLFSMLRVWLY